ncbi:MAG: helix-turn-helix domain-containing protein [Candidatus Buchananbacteria bacterium]
MVSFKTKEISNPPKIGERLQEQREHLQLSLEQAATATNISTKYLQALEEGDYKKLPGEVYAKSFLKAYAKFLGLQTDVILSYFASEQTIYSKTKNQNAIDHKKPVERVSRVHLLATPKLLRSAAVIILALFCLLYLGVKIKAIMAPPELIISQPVSDLVTEQNYIDVAGQVGKETTLEINGQQVMIDASGKFSETLELQEGTNLIEFKAITRHGREGKIFRQIVVNKKAD